MTPTIDASNNCIIGFNCMFEIFKSLKINLKNNLNIAKLLVICRDDNGIIEIERAIDKLSRHHIRWGTEFYEFELGRFKSGNIESVKDSEFEPARRGHCDSATFLIN